MADGEENIFLFDDDFDAILDLLEQDKDMEERFKASVENVLSRLQQLPSTNSATTEDLCNLYQRIKPTNRKVISMLKADPNNNSERAALDFLKRFVRGMGEAQLSSFMRYVTGADVLCVPQISVQFSALDGFARGPIARTCGSLLELPSTYNSYPELREEFSNILAKKMWQNDIV